MIIATGRSDYPNQVNNVLGFPFIFRGALDCRATKINMEMKLAASKALAELAKMDVPDAVLRAYSLTKLSFGRDYLIPKPFDYRVLLHVPVAVAQAAERTGVAQKPIGDYDEYRRILEAKLGRSRQLMHVVFGRARGSQKRIAFPEGDHDKIVRAAKILVDDDIAIPILLGREEEIRAKLAAHDMEGYDRITVIDPEKSPTFGAYAARLHELRKRHGVTIVDAEKLLLNRNYFAMMMLESGDADGVISGLTMAYPETIKPALQIVKTREGIRRASGAYVLMFKGREMVLADTTVNIEPTAEDLVEIAVQTAETARRFGIEPRIAMLSFSNYGSTTHPLQEKVKKAVVLLQRDHPELTVDGEMQADAALVPEIAEEFPWSRIQGDANVLIFPDLQSANLAYKLLWRLANAEVIGPILQGVARPVHVLQRSVDVSDIVNMTAIAVLDAQEADKKGAPAGKPAAAGAPRESGRRPIR